MKVSERINRAIAAKGWTQDEAAWELGVTRHSVNEVVMGRRRVTPAMAVRLATVFPDRGPAMRWLRYQALEDVTLAEQELHDWRTRYDPTRGRRNT